MNEPDNPMPFDPTQTIFWDVHPYITQSVGFTHKYDTEDTIWARSYAGAYPQIAEHLNSKLQPDSNGILVDHNYEEYMPMYSKYTDLINHDETENGINPFKEKYKDGPFLVRNTYYDKNDYWDDTFKGNRSFIKQTIYEKTHKKAKAMKNFYAANHIVPAIRIKNTHVMNNNESNIDKIARYI